MKRIEMEVYFKLFNSIKSEHEAKELAKIELEGLFGEVTPISNFSDVVNIKPFQLFTSEEVRIQDKVLHENPYGKVHGYKGHKDDIIDLTSLVKRLGYTREIYVIVKANEPENMLKNIFSEGILGKNVEFYQKAGFILFRLVTHQYFLENSEYISKLSRNEKEIDTNVELLSYYLMRDIYRIPASSTMQVGKRLEDYFAKREEPSLYFTHYIHPYKGKFHPKMVRALLNYVCPNPKEGTIVLDNFAGSGTLLLEATFMGINSYGVEINPLSVLMTNVKSHSLKINPAKLKKAVENYLEDVNLHIKEYLILISGQKTLTSQYKVDIKEIKRKKMKIPNRTLACFKNADPLIVDKILICNILIDKIRDKDIREFILLGLSGSISDASRRTKADFEEILEKRLNDLYRRIYLFHQLNNLLEIDLGEAVGHIGDTRDMKNIIPSGKIDGIINSPPYSTALDYIKFDEPQLTILELTESAEQLGWKMMGIPRAKYYPKKLLTEIKGKDDKFTKLPQYARETINKLVDAGRLDAGLRTYKFFVDMYATTEEMHRVLRPRGKCAIIIGNNHYKIGTRYMEVQNDRVILDIGEKLGFGRNKVIKRELEKTSVGNIRYESIVILEKLGV